MSHFSLIQRLVGSGMASPFEVLPTETGEYEIVYHVPESEYGSQFGIIPANEISEHYDTLLGVMIRFFTYLRVDTELIQSYYEIGFFFSDEDADDFSRPCVVRWNRNFNAPFSSGYVYAWDPLSAYLQALLDERGSVKRRREMLEAGKLGPDRPIYPQLKDEMPRVEIDESQWPKMGGRN